MAWLRWEYNSVSELCEKCIPERIVFIHIKNSWNTYSTSCSLFFWKRLIVKESVELIIEKVRELFFVLLFTKSTFTSVTCNKLSAAREFIDCKMTAVSTSFTSCKLCFICKRVNLIYRKHRWLWYTVISFSCNKGSAKSTHNTCDIRSDCLNACNLLKTSKNCVVVECTTLNNDMLT